ncbi:MAG: response regulator [Desulfuromonadaceae bacterium]|nr:response regulator [Desulfuromonadaceae bacterium]MDD2856913.1 response regulator [Desulfuromonadaceae bacterium]
MKSLVVDDDELSRVVLKEMLASNYDCDIASDGEEAFKLYLNAMDAMRPYDLILMDIVMPGCDGHTALAKIRAHEKGCGIEASKIAKIIMLTSLDDPKTILECYQNGATSYLVKPVSNTKLIQVLKNFRLIC